MIEEYSEEFVRKNAYWLDHNIEAREKYGTKSISTDGDFNKEQAAINQILKKPLIKDKTNPTKPLSKASIVSMYDGKVIDRNNPYRDV